MDAEELKKSDDRIDAVIKKSNEWADGRENREKNKVERLEKILSKHKQKMVTIEFYKQNQLSTVTGVLESYEIDSWEHGTDIYLYMSTGVFHLLSCDAFSSIS